MEGEGLQKGRRKLPDGAIAGAKEVNRLVLARPNQSRRLFHGRPEDGFGDPRKTDGPDGRIVDRGVEEHLAQRAKHPELLIRRARHGLAQLLEFLPGGAVVLP